MERFILERATDGKILDLEFPFDPSGVGRKLSGAGSLSGTVLPHGALPPVVPFQSVLHREVDGVIRGSHLVTRWSESGSTFQLEGVGFSAYPNGMRYDGAREWVGADPIAIIKHCWAHLQAKTGADLGVTVTGSSNIRIGEEKRDVSFKTRAGEDVDFEAGPYHLRWWDTPDLGAKITELGNTAQQEFVEWSAWDPSRSRIRKEIRYLPRHGRPLQLEFADDTSIVDHVEVVADGTDYANVIIALGAGEGKKALRVVLPASDGRLRRERVIERKNITSRKALEAEARLELRRAQRGVEIAAIEVLDHPAARFGEFGLGDDALVTVTTERHGRIKQRSRILEIEDTGDTAKLVLEAI